MPYAIDWAKTGQLTVGLICYGGFLWLVADLLHRHSPANWDNWDNWPDYEEPEETKDTKDFPALVEDDDSKLVA